VAGKSQRHSLGSRHLETVSECKYRSLQQLEKGGVENYNKQARHYVKKSSDISQYSDEYLQQMVEAKLNSRYMAVLGYRTTTEALVAYRKSKVP
jgi:IS30 family transposase